jgi:hypothetical protein
MYLKQVWCVKIKWIQLAHDRFQWWAVTFYTVTKLGFRNKLLLFTAP